MKLTPFAKIFITVIVLGVIGYATWHYFGAQIRCWTNPDNCAAVAKDAPKTTSKDDPAAPAAKDDKAVGKSDFNDLAGAPKDPGKEGVTGVNGAAVTGGKLGRPLKVGI